MRAIAKFIATYVLISVAIGLVWLATSYPDIPSTPQGYLWILGLALPLQIAAEFAGSVLWNNRLARSVEQRTAGREFSMLRICYGLLHFALVAGLLFAAYFGWQLLRTLI